MSLIPDDRKELLVNELKDKMEKPVKIVMFTQEIECRFCSDTRQLVQELATLNDKITVEIYDFVADAQKAKEYGIEDSRTGSYRQKGLRRENLRDTLWV